MKIIQNQPLQVNSKRTGNSENVTSKRAYATQTNAQNQSFKGIFTPLTMFLRSLDKSQALGAIFVDVAFMVTPRTAVDFTRGPEAGTETLRRESSGTVNHSLVGIYGLLAAAIMAKGINNKFGVKANKIFASNENIDIIAKDWDNSIKNNSINAIDDYLDNVLKKVEGFSNDKWNPLDEEAIKEIKKTLKAEFAKDQLKKEPKEYLKSIINYSTGSESQLRLKGSSTSSSSETLIDNLFGLTKSFNSQEVKKAFGENKLADNAFIKRLKKLNGKVSILGLGIAVAVGLCVQPLNMYLTKKKTGKDGFVGVEGRKPDKSNKFKLLKVLTAGAFGTMALGTIGSFKEILRKIQFHGAMPTLNQFKLVYGLTIMSRLLSARDKNELRESSIKDTLGFLNWLILGNFVAKLAAAGFEKAINEGRFSLTNSENGSKGLNWLLHSTIKTKDEVLHAELKKVGVETFTKDGKAKSFRELMKIAAQKAPIANKKIKFLNVAQLLGYIYSGLVLGFGIPKLNIAITNAINNKNKKKAASNPQ